MDSIKRGSVTETLFDLIKPAVTMEAMKDMVKTMVTAIVKAGLTAIFMAIKYLYYCCYIGLQFLNLVTL